MWCKYCKGLKTTGISKSSPATEITSGVAVVVRVASRTELALTASGALCSSSHINFVCWLLGISNVVWHWQMEHIPALGREAQEDPQRYEVLT